MSRSPPKSTLTKTLFPYTTLFRSRYKTVSDIGGALALLSRIVGARHQHLTFSSFDLPPVAPLAQKQIAAAGMEKRIKAVAGDFFKDELPKADVITMGNILHDWNLENKKRLIQKAYAALPEGGAFIAKIGRAAGREKGWK